MSEAGGLELRREAIRPVATSQTCRGKNRRWLHPMLVTFYGGQPKGPVTVERLADRGRRLGRGGIQHYESAR